MRRTRTRTFDVFTGGGHEFELTVEVDGLLEESQHPGQPDRTISAVDAAHLIVRRGYVRKEYRGDYLAPGLGNGAVQKVAI